MKLLTFAQVLLSSSLLIAAVLIARVALGRFVGQARYAMWGLVLLRLLLPVSFFATPASVWNAVTLEPLAAVGAMELPVFPSGTQTGPYYTDERKEDGTIVPYTGPREPVTTTLVWYELSIAQLARLVWFVGAAVVALRFLYAYNRFRRRLYQTRVPVHVDCKLPVYLADLPEAPCLFGVLRPAVYLTPQVAENEQATAHILAHELAHYAHGDHIWALLRSVCLVVYWFNPLVWLAAAVSRADCEAACDAAAVRRLGAEARVAYGRTLVDVLALRTAPVTLFSTATTMRASVRGIKRRLEQIVQNRPPKGIAVAALGVLLAVALTCTFTGVAAQKSTVQLRAKEGTVNPNRATFVLENNTDLDYMYGESFGLQRKTDSGDWEEVSQGGAPFHTIGYLLPAGESREKTWHWGQIYGTLPPGAYRLVTYIIYLRAPGDYDEYPLYGEFEVR